MPSAAYAYYINLFTFESQVLIIILFIKLFVNKAALRLPYNFKLYYSLGSRVMIYVVAGALKRGYAYAALA